jgi:hypothetical protein
MTAKEAAFSGCALASIRSRSCGLTFRREMVIHAPARSRDELVQVYAVEREGLMPARC